MKKSQPTLMDIIRKYYQYVVVGVLLVVLVIVLVVFALKKGSSKSDSKDKSSAKETEEEGTDPNAELEVPTDAPLEQNAHSEVNSFFTEYYQAYAEGDIGKIQDMGVVVDAEEEAEIRVKAAYTEDYENMSCFTKPGPEDDSYIVFVYYEVKFKNIDTLAPGLTTFYLCSNGGDFIVKDLGSLPQNMRDYITTIANQDDVQELLEQVDTLYTTNIENDPTLNAFMVSMQAEVDAAIAKAGSGGDAGGEQAAETAVSEVRVTTTDTVNIRSTPDQSGEKLGTAQKGDSFVRISEENGWSKISYKDGEAYIKSEFLTTQVGDTVVTAGTVTTGDNSGGGESAGGSTIEVNDAVNIRAGASTDSAKLGSAYKGDKYTLTGEENGWYKIDYNGTAGYIRQDFATKQ